MVPLSNPTTDAEHRYNRGHAQTRVIVEQTIGILKSHFSYHLLSMKQCPMLIPTLLCCREVDVLQAELYRKKSYKTSSSNEPPPAPAAPSPARPCSDESAVGFPVLERELPTLTDDTALSNPEAPVDPATPAEEGWMAPTPLLVEGSGPSRGPDTSGKTKTKCFHYCRLWQSCKCCGRQHLQHDQLHSSVCCLIWRSPTCMDMNVAIISHLEVHM
ncbi:uncharacterized protein LOC135104942 isoform X2 [Scylla paramamosain]|uniref:uncharacterized protein LOC135104942 isoform X2 n=1 Tax=Scylla paramamosain TaxID=85552 RepID=UPI003083946B